jgi:hypothetical protein
MKPWSILIAIAMLISVLAEIGCVSRRKSAAGLRLPDGDIQAGQAAFVELKCNTCHEVAGLDLPGPFADPPVPVVLGGDRLAEWTDGELVTAIANPSHGVPHGRRAALVRSGDLSRMGDFSEAMTVRQLIDIVSFLHSRYQVVSFPPTYVQ